MKVLLIIFAVLLIGCESTTLHHVDTGIVISTESYIGQNEYTITPKDMCVVQSLYTKKTYVANNGAVTIGDTVLVYMSVYNQDSELQSGKYDLLVTKINFGKTKTVRWLNRNLNNLERD